MYLVANHAHIGEIPLVFIWTDAAPDEIAGGHQERLRLVNGNQCQESFRIALARHMEAKHRGHRYIPIVLGLAIASGGDAASYLRAHSWLPSDRVVRLAGEQRERILMWKDRCADDWALYPLDWEERYFCNRCAEEDIDSMNFSYWRRAHQFPGIDRCLRHRNGLSKLRRSSFLTGLPHTQIQMATPVDPELVACFEDDPIIARYERISAGLLHRDVLICEETATHVLSRRCQELGLITKDVDWNRALRREILMQLPSAWLAAHFNSRLSSGGRDLRHYSELTTYSFWKPRSTGDYTLSLALLFDSAEQALKRFSDSR